MPDYKMTQFSGGLKEEEEKHDSEEVIRAHIHEVQVHKALNGATVYNRF